MPLQPHFHKVLPYRHPGSGLHEDLPVPLHQALPQEALYLQDKSYIFLRHNFPLTEAPETIDSNRH